MTRPLVVALGSTVMGDDGLGSRVLKELEKHRPDAELVELGTDILKLRLFFTGQKKLIILDALRGDEEPGTVLVFQGSQFQDRLSGDFRNPHMLGVVEGLALMRSVDPVMAAAEVFLVGVVAERIDKGEELSPVVEAALPEAVAEVLRLIRMNSFS